MIELDEDGKPCRTCNSLSDFQQAMFGKGGSAPALPLAPSDSSAVPTQFGSASRGKNPGSATGAAEGSAAGLAATIPGGFREPPDSLELGQNTWTFLHSLAAYYPVSPSSVQKQEMQQFLTLFSHFYPCKPCARDFERYVGENAPNVNSRSDLSLWMCDAHNAVNTKLGKPTFDCKFWKARWREGWEGFLKSQE